MISIILQLLILAPLSTNGFSEEVYDCSSFMCAYRLGEKLTLLDVESRNNKEEIASLKGEISELTGHLENEQKEIANLKKEIADLKRQQDARVVVSTYAKLTSTVKLDNGEKVHYDTVITNVGDAYDARTGQFTTPVVGVYSIGVTVCTGASGHWMNVDILKNGETIGKVRAGDLNYYECTSASVIVQLDKGDNVWVQRDSGASQATFDNSQGWNTFTVNLIGEADQK